MIKKILLLSTVAVSIGLTSCYTELDKKGELIVEKGPEDNPSDNPDGSDDSGDSDDSDDSDNTDDSILTVQGDMQDYLSSLKIGPALHKDNDTSNARVHHEANDIPTGIVAFGSKKPGVVDGIPGYWVETKTHHKISQIFDETILLDPTAEILYPGCVLRGNSIEDGSYTPLSSSEVGDITFSISNVVAPFESPKAIQKTIHNIRLSDYRVAFNAWSHLNFQKTGVTSIHSVESVSAEEEVLFKLGASFQHKAVNIAANLGFDFSKENNHVLAKFIQKQYDVTMDIPKTPTIFTSIDKNYIKEYQPVYVSNITYGRMIFMSVDTKHSLADVKAALDLAVKAIKLDVDLDAKYRKVMDESKISVTIVGGNADSQNLALTNGWEGFKAFMTSNTEMPEATPISFTMRFASDNSVARVNLKTEYDVIKKTFVKDFKEVCIEMNLDGLRGKESRRGIEGGSSFDMYGSGWVSYNNQTSEVFNISKNNYVEVQKGDSFSSVNTPNTVVCIKRPQGMEMEEFLRSRVRFYTHMRDNDGRVIESNNKDYGESYQEISIEELIANSQAGNKEIIVVSNGHGIRVEAKYKFTNLYYNQ